jgi:hypothetical protein
MAKIKKNTRQKHVAAYKIVDQQPDGSWKTLFHGVAGDRRLPTALWMRCEEKMVSDGTSKHQYLSGWHVLLCPVVAADYMKRFKTRLDRLKIVPCTVMALRRKPRARHPVFLARWIKF